MIVFGWGNGTPKDLGEVLPVSCPNCRNDVVAHYFTVTRWFRLYFIPVVPLKKRHLLICPICTRGIDLTRQQGDAARELAGGRATLPPGSQEAHEHHEQRVAEFRRSLAGPPPLDAGRDAPPLDA